MIIWNAKSDNADIFPEGDNQVALTWKVSDKSLHIRRICSGKVVRCRVASFEVVEHYVLVTTERGGKVALGLYDPGAAYCDSKKQKRFWADKAQELFDWLEKNNQ